MKIALFAFLGVVVFVGISLVSRCVIPTRKGISDASDLLRGYIAERRGYLIFIGVPFDSPQEWKQAQVVEDQLFMDDKHLRYNDITSFLVVYPTGDVLHAEQEFFPLPDGVRFSEPNSNPRLDILDPQELIEGQAYVKISHGHSKSRRDELDDYSTTVQNLSEGKIRVIKFAAFAKSGDWFQLSTITRDYFSAADFISWYDAPKDGWIPPSESVTDLHNYGGGDVYWVYYFETEDGNQFKAGARLP